MELHDLSLEELEARCDPRLLDLFRQWHVDDPQQYRVKVIKHLKRYSLPVTQLLDAIRSGQTPEEAWQRVLAVCRTTIPAAPWHDLASPELAGDIADAQSWLTTTLSLMPEATGIYLGLDTLNMRGGAGKNVEIGGTPACDPLSDSRDWLQRRLAHGERHFIRGLYELQAAYTRGPWLVADDEVPLGSYAGFAGYVVFLTYSGIVLGHALSRIAHPTTRLTVWGFHDGDVFLLGRATSGAFTFLCR